MTEPPLVDNISQVSQQETSLITSAGLSSVLRCIIAGLGRNQPDNRIREAWLQEELALHKKCLEPP